MAVEVPSKNDVKNQIERRISRETSAIYRELDNLRRMIFRLEEEISCLKLKGGHKMKLVLMSFVALFVCTALVSAIEVNFNGEFANGTTLYSDTIYVKNHSLYGKDVYPDRTTISTQQICTNSTITYVEPVCTKNVTYVTRTVRVRHGKNVTYETITKERVKKVCKLVTKTREVQSCQTKATPIGCKNPDGIYTNQLSLANFRYSTNGGATWNSIPYGVTQADRVYLIDKNVIFKVDIPSRCSPSYYIDKAIIIEEY